MIINLKVILIVKIIALKMLSEILELIMIIKRLKCL